MNEYFARGELFFSHGRYPQAEEEFRGCIAEVPEFGLAYTHLALCLVEQGKFREAQQFAKEGIALDGASSFAHYALAVVMIRSHRFAEARQALDEAIRLNPRQPAYFGALAHLHFENHHWSDALAAADAGLELDPENDQCTNYRAMAQRQLGRHGDAVATIEAALARNPENAITHCNQGWQSLEAGKADDALRYFSESLRLDPTSNMARAGLVEAFKAKNPLYRPLLWFLLWSNKLSHGAQWAVMIGSFFVLKSVREASESSPQLEPYLSVVILLLVIAIQLTWIGEPLFNLMLFLHRRSRQALSGDQTAGAILVGSLVGTALILYVASLALGNVWLRLGALAVAALIIPASTIFRCVRGWPRNVMIADVLVLAAIAGFLAIATIIYHDTPAHEAPGMVAAIKTGINLFVQGAIFSQILAIFMMRSRPRR